MRREIVMAIKEFRNQMNDIPSEFIQRIKNIINDTSVKIVENLKESILNGHTDGIDFDELRSLDMHTADIESNCDTLKTEILLDRFGGRQICQKIDGSVYVPVSYAHEMDLAIHQERATTRLLKNREAVESFGSELVHFVNQRFAANVYVSIRQTLGGMSSMPLMLPITVTAHTLGARVEYAPSYFIRYITLAAPTSPVQGVLLPGRYIFKITTRTTMHFDKGVFDIPPTFNVDLMV